MPDMKKPIENPELVAALAALHQENTPQNQGRVLELVLHHAVLLAPAVVTPPPQAQQGGTAAAVSRSGTRERRLGSVLSCFNGIQAVRPELSFTWA